MSSPISPSQSVLEYERRAEQCWREAKERARYHTALRALQAAEREYQLGQEAK